MGNAKEIEFTLRAEPHSWGGHVFYAALADGTPLPRKEAVVLGLGSTSRLRFPEGLIILLEWEWELQRRGV